jgi:hypothetical protein
MVSPNNRTAVMIGSRLVRSLIWGATGALVGLATTGVFGILAAAALSGAISGNPATPLMLLPLFVPASAVLGGGCGLLGGLVAAAASKQSGYGFIGALIGGVVGGLAPALYGLYLALA